ncbi:MAG: Gfo/Idh/MocA family oxidoreductase [Anaerolineae bacterium]|nr:Gfo/Idh/MocA family oxidoreductase [Anaerolineae bacterium]
MAATLRALIQGSGFAGQGHTLALRDAGVEIVGMVSRTPEVVQQVAAELTIPYASTDWTQALRDLQPDIVAIGTPGGAHYGPILEALAMGCHVYCDKPLAVTAAEAKHLYQKAIERGVKTAYATSYRYQPHALLAKELIASGSIGEPQEVECISHYNLNPLIPFGWSHRMDQGGGRLNNNFTHKLAIVLHVLDGQVLAVNGETRNDLPRAPIVHGVHDFRERERFAPAANQLEGAAWAEGDAEWSYTVLAHMQPGPRTTQPVSALFKHSGLQPRYQEDYVAFYGSEAALYISGSYAQGPLMRCPRGGTWQAIPLPAHITDALPAIDDDTQRNWTQLAREFVADIRGEGSAAYQTFREGWMFQEIIDAVRAGRGWFQVPQDL